MKGLAPHTEQLALLTNGVRFTRDSHFEQMSPIYSVSALEIENYIKSLLKHK